MKEINSSDLDELKQQPETPIVSGIPLYSDGGREKDRFVVQGAKDVWAAVLFLIFAGAVSVKGTWNWFHYQLPAGADNTSYNSGDDGQVHHLWNYYTLAGALLSALALPYLIVVLFIKVPKYSIYVCTFLFAIFNLFVATIQFVHHDYIGGAVFLILGLYIGLWLFAVRSRIPFTALLLHHSGSLLVRYPSLQAINGLCLSLITLFVAIPWTGNLLPLAKYHYDYEQYENQNIQFNPSQGSFQTNPPSTSPPSLSSLNISFLILSLFTLYWLSQVLYNIIHTTASGLMATWYFCFPSMPSSPSFRSFQRSVTTSLGSICLGSLIVAVLMMVRALLTGFRNQTGGSFVVAMLRCLAVCILACLEGLVRLFNHYAFIHVAIYGCGYVEAAKRTWELTLHSGASVIVTHCLVSWSVFMASFSGALLLALVWGLAVDATLGWIVLGISYFYSLFVLKPIKSFVTTLMVCYAEVPTALEATAPDLYHQIHSLDQPV